MPRNVRNFWIELYVDGMKTKIDTGPRSSGGGFQLRIRMRENGQISERYIEIDGAAREDDSLILSTRSSVDGDGFDLVTKR